MEILENKLSTCIKKELKNKNQATEIKCDILQQTWKS